MTLYSQSNNHEVESIYKELAKKPLTFVEFSDSIKTTQGAYDKNNRKTDFLLLEISKSINLKFKKFTYANPNSPYLRDSIFLFDQKYCIDNLFYEKKSLKNEIPLRFNYASSYSFSIKSKDYISVFFWDSTVSTSDPYFFILLFNVSDRKQIKTYFFDEQKSFNPFCFGDFNNDGNLDFASWNYKNRIESFTFSINGLKKVKNKYIIVEQNLNTVSINWSKSKWYNFQRN